MIGCRFTHGLRRRRFFPRPVVSYHMIRVSWCTLKMISLTKWQTHAPINFREERKLVKTLLTSKVEAPCHTCYATVTA